MMQIKPGLPGLDGWWDFDPKDDMTPVESAHLAVLFATFAVVRRGMDFWGYVREHKLERHFKQKKEEEATIDPQKAV